MAGRVFEFPDVQYFILDVLHCATLVYTCAAYCLPRLDSILIMLPVFYRRRIIRIASLDRDSLSKSPQAKLSSALDTTKPKLTCSCHLLLASSKEETAFPNGQWAALIPSHIFEFLLFFPLRSRQVNIYRSSKKFGASVWLLFI